MEEHEETLKNIAKYEDILNNYDSMAAGDHGRSGCVSRKNYGRKRRTVIENAEEAVFEEKKVEETGSGLLDGSFRICEDSGCRVLMSVTKKRQTVRINMSFTV